MLKAVMLRTWLPLVSLFAVTGCAWAQTPGPASTPPIFRSTPTASLRQSEIPNGVSAPPAIPTIPALRNPLTVQPGSMFGNNIVHGDGATDDTAGIQAALNASDIIVAPATYAIAGSVSIPTGRNISCQSGAIFFDTQTLTTKMFNIGFSSSSIGNNSIVGCTFKGTDTATNYSTYQGGGSTYSELLEIASGWGLHTDSVLIENNTFMDAQGDALLTYSPCGTANTGAPCNSGAPGTEGPSNIFIVNDTVQHCAQPGVHLNGGQNIVVTGLVSTDCNNNDEVDSNVLQIISSWWYKNKFTTQYGTLDAINGHIVAPEHSCTGDDLIPENDSKCYSFNNDIDGTGSGGPSILHEPSGCAGGGGHYVNESLTNGAQLRTGC